MKHPHKQGGNAIIGLLALIFIIAGVWGWVANILALVHHVGEGYTFLELVRLLGILVFPLGVVLGWLL
jgi:hypothetical protein